MKVKNRESDVRTEVVESGRVTAPLRLSKLTVTGRSAPRRTQLHPPLLLFFRGSHFLREWILPR